MTELTCIVCPRGCTLRIEERDGRFTVTGNACKRGEQFATAEMTCPTRTLCTTVRTVFPEVPVISVRTSAEIPKDKIFDVMREINRARVTRPMKRGEAVLPNVLGLGVDIIITSGLLEEKTEKVCGRPHAYLRKYGICRICFRKYAYEGAIPGVTKASW